MRKEKGLPEIADSDPDSEKVEKDEDLIDVLLNEAAKILNDLIVPQEEINVQTVYKLN